MKRSLRSALILLVASLSAPRALAQQPVDDPAQVAAATTNTPTSAPDYEVALAEALSAHTRGEYEQARIFMERAHSLEPSARTLRGLGIIAFAQGRHLQAIDYFDAALQSSVKALPADLRAGVEELRSHCWGQLGRFRLQIDPVRSALLVDGKKAAFYAPDVIALTPGQHLLVVDAADRARFAMPLQVAPGDDRTLQIVLAAPATPRVVERWVQPTASQSERRPERTLLRRRRLLWIGGSLLVGAGAVLYGTAFSRLHDLSDRCADMLGGGCSNRKAIRLYREENVAELGVAGGVTAGLGLLAWVGAAVFEVRQSKRAKASSPQAKLRFSGHAIALEGHF